jgi:LmbE family N-acetylglucosaminyl deacetylase
MGNKKMMNLKLSFKGASPQVLCLGAHSDDIEIGCGGTVLKLISKHKHITFTWVVLSSSESRKREAMNSAEAFLAGAERRTVTIKDFKDGFFPYVGGEIKEFFEDLKREFNPDLIFTPHRMDMHQDHRLISDLTWNTFRDNLILEYEIPKYDGDLGAPNVFVHLDEAYCRTKIQNILKHFKTQSANHWFTEDAFRAILRLRGIESNAPSKYAEAFHARKLSLA